MSFELVVPRHRWSRATLVFEKWLMDDGDWVKRGNAVCALDVNGVRLPIVSEQDGFLTIASKLAPNETLIPGTVLAFVTRPSETIPMAQPAPPAIHLPPRNPVDLVAASLRKRWQPSMRRNGASPRARLAGRNMGVPLRAVQGSGSRRRILERDVLAAAPAVAAAGAAIPAWCSRDIVLSELSPLWWESPLATILKSVTADNLQTAEGWDAAQLRAMQYVDGAGYRSPQTLDDLTTELEENDVPFYVATSPDTSFLLPPLPPVTLFSLGFGAPTSRPIVAQGRIEAAHAATITAAFDSDRLAPSVVERWLASV